MNKFEWAEGRVVLTIKAKNRQEAQLALEMMMDHLKDCEPDEEVEGRVTVPNEGVKK